MKKILDLGCGKGEYSNYLAKCNKNYQVYGVDINKKSISFANRNKFYKEQVFKVCRAEKIPFENNFFDKIYCFEVLEHVADLNKTLSEIVRTLKVGGKFIFSVPTEESEEILSNLNPDYSREIGHRRVFSREDIMKMLNEFKMNSISYEKYNAMEHIFWVHIFKRNGKIIDQLGSTDIRAKKYIRVLNFALSKDVFYLSTLPKRKDYRVAVFILGTIFYPFGRVLDLFKVNKRQRVIAIK